MQIDFLLELPLPPSGGYDKISTAIEVISRYAFAWPLSNHTAVNTAKGIIEFMTRHSYLPIVMIKDKGSVLVSNLIHKKADVLGITLRHATTKHAEFIAVLGRTNASINSSLKNSSGEIAKHWYKNQPLAILNRNTTYHAIIGRDPSRQVQGRVPYNILHHKLGLKLNIGLVSTTYFADEILRTHILYDKIRKKMMQSYIRYKKFYDKKAKASPLQEKTTATYYNLKRITKDPICQFATLDGLALM